MIPVLRFASVFDISIRFVAAKGNGHLNPIVLAVILYHAWWMREIRCLVMTNAWMGAQQLVSWFSTWCWNTCIEIGFTPPIQINLYLPRLLPGRGGRSNIYMYMNICIHILCKVEAPSLTEKIAQIDMCDQSRYLATTCKCLGERKELQPWGFQVQLCLKWMRKRGFHNDVSVKDGRTFFGGDSWQLEWHEFR